MFENGMDPLTGPPEGERPEMHPTDIVRAGYDAVCHAYRGDVETADCTPHHQWLDELLPLLPPATRVLDLGCGCGIPVARRLARTHQVTGVDLSPVQIHRARELVPAARFLCVDMTAVEFPPRTLRSHRLFLRHHPCPPGPAAPAVSENGRLAAAWRLSAGHGGA